MEGGNEEGGGDDGGGSGEALAPPDPPTRAPAFQWAAVSPVPGGAPLQMNYSPHKSTEELMCGYGFTLPANPADFFHVALGVGGAGADAVQLRPRLIAENGRRGWKSGENPAKKPVKEDG